MLLVRYLADRQNTNIIIGRQTRLQRYILIHNSDNRLGVTSLDAAQLWCNKPPLQYTYDDKGVESNACND